MKGTTPASNKEDMTYEELFALLRSKDEGSSLYHYTDGAAAKGITGIDTANLAIGDNVTVGTAAFGRGQNAFLAAEEGDIFLTDIGPYPTTGELESVGVFGDKQNFGIQFSRATAAESGVPVTAAFAERGIYTIPGGSVLTGEGIVLRRLQ